ncbi:MAG: DUF58 domain-containing protein [Elusimicrobia bacterium]|nr:DUF58 domain-containing protein [Elusimicrobiota bacterium]
MPSLIDPDVIAQIKGLRLVPRFSERSVAIGAQSTSWSRGASSEFVDYRSYVPGEDPRRIDWRVYARKDRYFLRSYQGETNCTIWLAIDASRSMTFRASGASQDKWTMSARAALGLCYSALASHDACGMALFGEGILELLRPKASWEQLAQAAHLLENFSSYGDRTDFSGSFGSLAAQMPRRAVVVIFSDFIGEPVEKLVSSFEALSSRRHEIVALRVVDPTEINLSAMAEEQMRVRPLETKTQTSFDVDLGQIRRIYQERWQEEESQLSGWLLKRGIDYRLWTTLQDVGRSLADYLMQRSHRRQPPLRGATGDAGPSEMGPQ